MSTWADSTWRQLVGSRPVVGVSAPGKILITGGYLVLDSRYNGLVIAVNARFTSRVALLPDESEYHDGQPRVILIAPQVAAHPMTASLSLGDRDALLRFAPKRNAFVENAIHFSFNVLRECVPDFVSSLRVGLAIYTDANAAFYSEFGADGVAKAKSGLGSSAALVSSVTAALFALFKVHDMKLCYRTAQLAHCAAQSKVGSGFDVSAAFFGSQIYHRFDPNIVSPFLNGRGQSSKLLVSFLKDDSAWSDRHTTVVLPEGVTVVLGDVRLGSETPVMVKRVLEWLKSQPLDRWDELGRLNRSFTTTLEALRSCSVAVLEQAAVLPHDRWGEYDKTGALLLELRRVFFEIRNQLRKIGAEAGVDIEPVSQTALLDATMEITGVICAGIPGAGGYDAIFAVYIGGERTRHRIEQLWCTQNVTAIDIQQDANGLVSTQ